MTSPIALPVQASTMSESLALFRPNQSKDLKQLAEEHLQHEQVNLDTLTSDTDSWDTV